MSEPVNDVFKVEEVEGGVAIVGLKKSFEDGEVVFPGTIDGKRVVEIGKGAFEYNNELTSVVISDGIEKIGENAFSSCRSLKRVVLPGSVKEIGDWAFSFNDNLVFNELIPSGVKKIGVGAFSGCNSIERIYIPKGVEEIGDAAFCGLKIDLELDPENSNFILEDGVLFDCKKEKLLYFPPNSPLESYVIPDTVKEICDNAFEDSSLTSVIIPEGVKRIGTTAFFFCSGIECLDLPRSVEEFGDEPFEEGPQMVRVHEDSYAEEWACGNLYQFEVIELEDDEDDEE